MPILSNRLWVRTQRLFFLCKFCLQSVEKKSEYKMKRSIDSTDITRILGDGSEPISKVILVEREVKPCEVALVNPTTIAKKSYIDLMELEKSVSNVSSSIQVNAQNRLEIIGRQMKNLKDVMTDVFLESKRSLELHNVACNFVKKPGHVYHLYERPSGQRYFGMLSPEDWQNPPHKYLGSYLLEADLSWVPAQSYNERHQGIEFLKEMFATSHFQALT